MIEVRDLVKRYGSHTAVDHLSFTVEQGKVYGFLGPNGAGKSTTMNIMTGYLGATSGEVLVDGHSIAAEPAEVKRRIGYLPEIPPLYPDMTVEEYLRFAAGLKKVPKPEVRGQLDRVEEMTMLTDVRGRLIRNLSKGYRQRVGLAQALLGFPEILILDEPTVGLDPKQIIEIRALIRTLSRDHTVILSSHILSEVQEVCDHIFIISHGKLAASGSPAQLEQDLSGPGGLELTLRAPAEPATGLLRAVDGVEGVEPLPAREPDTFRCRLLRREGRDIREEVFRACAAAGLVILDMRSDGMTLEDIFLKLTADAPPLPTAGPEEADEPGEPEGGEGGEA